MGSVDDLPPQNPVQHVQDEAEVAFEEMLRRGGQIFDSQHQDRRDYGTDYQLELVEKGQRTNIRVHVQLKGTEDHPNKDGSISISVPRSNLNYLLTQPSSIYVCYSLWEKKLLVRTAEDVFRMYERTDQGGHEWMNQESITVRFSDPFDIEFQRRFHTIALANNRSARDRRLAWAVALPEKASALVNAPLRQIPVPLEATEARRLLQNLYENAEDEAISASFEQFLRTLHDDVHSLNWLYMAEINLGLNEKPFHRERVQAGITHLDKVLKTGGFLRGSILYSLGNAWAALDSPKEALGSYEEALKKLTQPSHKGVAAQCWKNLGSTLRKLGRDEESRKAFEQALSLNPDLPEAHLALGLWFERHEDLANALQHLDLVSKSQGSALSMRSVNARRAKILFQLGDDWQAFQTINSIVAAERLDGWEWQWCAMLISDYGTKTTSSAKRALTFWRRFLGQHPGDKYATEEKFHCLWQLNQEGEDTNTSFSSFEQLAREVIDNGVDDKSRIWDRVGHWAQSKGDWAAAEKAFRQAAEGAPERYGYCLGVALNHLDRFPEALSALLPDGNGCQLDALAWFQVAFACEHVGDIEDAVEAYVSAITLDPDYALAYFNLGGIYWNNRDIANALAVWSAATERFPKHKLALKLQRDLPKLFGRKT